MYTRTHPFIAKIKERRLLTKLGSSRKTYHIVLEIDQPGLEFKVGDSIGVIPNNAPNIIDQILEKIKASGEEEVIDKKTNLPLKFRDYLLTKANINKVSFHKLYPVEKTSLHLLDLLDEHQPSPNELCSVLLPLLPRFYSIASSWKVHPNEIHLTVAFASYVLNGQTRFGVGSYFLCEQADIQSTPIPIYVQPSNHFTLPDQPDAPIILIGPGTGVAPFRAFIQERLAKQESGKNWLFFGERNRSCDFYYEDYWLELEEKGILRLDTAFSRDQPEKIYVQHKMLEHKKSIWEWIQDGCYIYVCGDANKMAKDVEAALVQIGKDVGHLNDEDARKFFKTLRLEKRYLLDVY